MMPLLVLAALPVAGAEELPTPPGSRRNAVLSGATTLGPGKNYTRNVYETDDGIDAVANFYRERLPGSTAMREGEGIRFSVPSGIVELLPLGTGTRITLIVGPR